MTKKKKPTARQIEIAEELKAAPRDGTEWIKHLPPVPPIPSRGVKVVVLRPEQPEEEPSPPDSETGKHNG